MGCTHTSGCPLFPKMNASLRGWRDVYCDSGSGWQSCARYRLSLTGRPVPLTLLPNGRDAQALRPPGAGGPAVSRFATSRQVVLDPAARTPFEAPPEAPPRPPSTSRHRRPVGSGTAGSTAVPAPAAHRPRPEPARRSWWVRLADWMRGPA